ncbi:MAG: primosomal protein N' [Firmicutes bacterium]|nr:primosomal protein N' [Bacillota bacterium]
MIARIVVDHRFKETDKVFDYLIPPELEDDVEIGSRVIVPFSKANTEIEGFCVEIKESTKVKNLKPVMRLVTDVKAFDGDMLAIIKWMREKYLVSYQDIIRTVIPSGSNIKSEEIITLENDAETDDKRCGEIISILKDSGGRLEIKKIEKAAGFNARPKINEMIKAGVVSRSFKQTSAVSQRTQKHVRLLISEDAARDESAALIKKAPVQSRMIDVLAVNGGLSVTDLLSYTGGSKSTLDALVRKGFAEVYDEVVERSPFKDKTYTPTEKMPPTYEQQRAIDEITHSMKESEGRVFLLHGVTGSGKTEVFMQAIDYCISNGKTALVLVPEISLTSQMVSRFVSRFGARVAVLHSALSLGERYDQWLRIYEGGADIVIGARSAVFAPLKNMGIIIVDEEHSSTYKSEMSPRYQAKDVAIKRAEQCGAAVVLASATPCVESMYRARGGEYELITMKERFNKNKMPDIFIEDMREELKNGNKSMLSERLKSEIIKNIENKEQTILFLNRRGFSTFVSCRSCGYVAKCPNCNISLTYNRAGDALKCHYCGYTRANYKICPSCGSKYIRYFGGGTQKVEAEIKSVFPDIKTIRMDIDTTGKKQSHEKILERFETENIDVLIGTQMVAKGLDFENVTLVGVISADTMLNMEDYRSAERTFSMLEQVSGRAGRGKKAGRAVIQSYSPENEAIALVKEHNYIKFYENEILQRKLLWYPPYSEIVCIMFSSGSQTLAAQCAKFFAKEMGSFDGGENKVAVLGPAPSAISKLKNKYRYQIIVKCSDCDSLNERFEKARSACKSHKNYGTVSIVIDKEPNML